MSSQIDMSDFPSPFSSGSGWKKIGELLVEQKLVTPGDVAKALQFQEQFGGRLGGILVRIGALSDDVLFPVLSDQLGIPLLHSSEWPEGSEPVRQQLSATPYSVG